jgi:hypothetical protein
MKRLLFASALVLAAAAMTPSRSMALWNSPQNGHAYPWLQAKALNFMSANYMHGPLYSYGPYTGQGYWWMYVANPWCGGYVPAYPARAYGGYVVPPGTNFNQLPYPPGALPLPGGEPPIATTPPANVPADKQQAPQKMPTLPNPDSIGPKTPASTSNYYGGEVPGYFSPARLPQNR